MKFLACTDGSPYAEKAIKASAIAAKHAGYGLTLLYVIEDVVSYADFPDDKGFRIRKEKGDAILAKAKEIVEKVSKDIQEQIKLVYPDMNLYYLDFDAGISEANIRNRLHFMIEHL